MPWEGERGERGEGAAQRSARALSEEGGEEGVEEGEEDTRWVTYDIITFGAAAAHAAPHGFHGGGILRWVKHIILIGLNWLNILFLLV